MARTRVRAHWRRRGKGVTAGELLFGIVAVLVLVAMFSGR